MSRKLLATLTLLVFVILSLYVFLIPQQCLDNKPVVAIFNYVSHPILDTSITGIKKELIDSGYDSSRLRIIEINANGQMALLNSFAQELLGSSPDVIVPVSTPVTQAVVKVASPEQAIVFSTVTNPDDVRKNSEPKNMTGVADVVDYRANIELIRQIVPNLRSIGMIYNPGERNSQIGKEETGKILEALGIEFDVLPITSSGEVADAARTLAEKSDVIYIGPDNTVASALDAVIAVAYEQSVPVFASDHASVLKGALAAVSVNYETVGREAGKKIVAVLRGNELPRNMKDSIIKGTSIVVNKNSAAKLNLEIPLEIQNKAEKIVP